MRNFPYKIQTKRKAPQRSTQPHSFWREKLNAMKPGHWFLIPVGDKAKANAAGTTYCKGRYTLYQHPVLQGTYVFLRTR